MDKEKCIFNKNGSCNIYAWSCDYADSCKGNPDCIIKRLQAENEELKEQLDNNFKLCSDCSTTHSFNLQVSENKKLKQENEQLKEENELIKERSKELYIFSATYENDKIKQALQEIKDIVSEQCQQCFVIDGFTKPDDCGICDYKRILDKINEVIGAE